jgi:hypothetical protein
VRFGWTLAIGLCVAARAIAACDSTPDLNYSGEDATAEGGSGFDATQSPDTSPGDDTSTPPDTARPDGGGADADATRDVAFGGDAEPDVPATDASSTDACPMIDADANYACCANVGVICVDESCKHCGDCANAHCNKNEYCCPYFAGGSGNYKGTDCKSQVTCQ